MTGLLEEAERKAVTLCSSWATGEQLQRIEQAIIVAFHGLEVSKPELALSTEVLPPYEEYLKQFLAIKLVKGLSPKTLTYYKLVIRSFFSKCDKPVSKVTTNDIRVYLAIREMQEHASKCTLNNERRVFRSFFGTLANEGLIAEDPARRIDQIKEPKRIKKPFTELELEQIRDAVSKLGKGKEQARNMAIIEVLYSTGCRVSELCGMNRNAIQDDRITVVGKGNKERVCYLNTRALMALSKYFATRGDSNIAMFVTKYGRISTGMVERMVRELGKLAGIENCHPHRFRRTAATIALRRGMPIEQVSQMLGHAELTTTQIYAITSEDDVHASHQKYLS